MHQFPLSSRQKVPVVCFRCRVGMKRVAPLRLKYEDAVNKERPSTGYKCPRCSEPMAYVGRYFKIPPQSALKQWRKAELLWQSGWLADGYSPSPGVCVR